MHLQGRPFWSLTRASLAPFYAELCWYGAVNMFKILTTENQGGRSSSQAAVQAEGEYEHGAALLLFYDPHRTVGSDVYYEIL